MRFFRHGDSSIAIVLPEKIRKSSEVKEEEEYEFFEAEKGTFILISKKNLEELTKKSAWAELLKGKAEQPSEQKHEPEIRDDAEPEKLISSGGFAVISSEEEARRISKLFEKEIKTNDVIGVRGFDKKFYIVSAKYFRENASKLMKLIGAREMPLKDIALASKMDESGCLACLMLLKEQGELIEKRRGVFKAVK
ncbi:MAG: hypothetical protein ABIG96_03835 [Candidatus Micrarchaeota archaeon]